MAGVTKAARAAVQAIEELTGCKLTPAEALHLVCAECGEVLLRAQHHWCCARGHGRLIPEAVLFCRLTGYPENRLLVGATKDVNRRIRTEQRDAANAFARRHNGVTPQQLLKRILEAQERSEVS